MEATLDALGESFERFRKAQIDVLPIGIGKCRMKEHMIELLIGDDDTEFIHVGEVDSQNISWLMNLIEGHILFDALSEFPVSNTKVNPLGSDPVFGFLMLRAELFLALFRVHDARPEYLG